MNIPTQHGKKIMYAGLLLLFAAFFLFDPNLTRTLHIVDAKVSIDKVIREGNLVASLPVSPQRGDIVVYKSENKLWARRLIGLPGDVIGVADGGIYIDGKPIDTTFLAKAGPILPAFNNYRVPPNRVIVGTGNTGTFKLIEIDKPNEMRYGELIFSASRLNREVFLSLLVGTGYLFLLVFGPLFVESWLDPTERLYRVLKVSWYGLWLLALVVVLSGSIHQGRLEFRSVALNTNRTDCAGGEVYVTAHVFRSEPKTVRNRLPYHQLVWTLRLSPHGCLSGGTMQSLKSSCQQSIVRSCGQRLCRHFLNLHRLSKS